MSNPTASTTGTLRPLSQIADEIRRVWKPRIYFGAVPYVDAMSCLDTVGQMYGADHAGDIVLYFLSNAKTWRGPDAQRIKAELKGMLKAAAR